jgi:hypothetical protein
MKATFKNATTFGGSKPSVGGRKETVKVSDQVEMLEWPKKGKPVTIRFLGGVAGRGIHKIKVRKKDGNEVDIQKPCLAYDPTTDEKDSTVKCPYCKLPSEMAKFSKLYFVNAIIRELQEDKPAKTKKPTAAETKSGFKEIDSETWTPVRVVRVPSSLSLRIKQLGEKNIVKSKTGAKKAFEATHEKFGFDLDVTFDKSLPAANMYSADRAESPDGGKYSPLSEEENNLLIWDLDPLYEKEDFDTAKKEATSLQDRFGGPKDDEDDEDDDEDEDEKPRRGSKKASRDDDEDDEDDLDLDDDEDEKPAKKSSKKPVKKSSRDEDEDDEDEDEDEEDEPPAKKGKKPVKKSSRDSDDEDDDEDDLDLDDEDDEDEPPAKKKPASKKPVKKASRDEDEDDEDDLDDLDEDEDEDEEDEPPAKKKPAAKKTSRR